MAKEKAIGNLVVHMGIDDAEVQPTINKIKQNVKSLTNEWKANSTAQKALGNDLEAAKAKYEGLSKVVEAQTLLVKQQEDILASTGGRTKENALQYDKLSTSLSKSKEQLTKYTAQLAKAQHYYEFQETGIPKINEAIQQEARSTSALVEKLQAQGQVLNANRAQLASNQRQLKNYNDLREKEKTLLNAIAEQSGKSSEAYQKQAIVVNNVETKIANLKKTILETSTAMKDTPVKQLSREIDGLNSDIKEETEYTSSLVAKLKAQGKVLAANKAQQQGNKTVLQKLNEIREREIKLLEETASKTGKTSSEYKKQELVLNNVETKIANLRSKQEATNRAITNLPLSKFSQLNTKLIEVGEKAESTSHIFGKMFGAQVMANAFINALGTMKDKFVELLHAGEDYNEEQQKMNAVWTTLTGKSKNAKDMVNTINDLAVKTGQATDTVNELEQGFYHLHSDKKESDAMTKSMLNMADAVGLTNDQIQAVTQDMVNGLSRGKANAGMLNQISQYFPMFREQLADYENRLGKTSDKAAKTGKKTVSKLNETQKAIIANFKATHSGTKITLNDLEKCKESGQISGNVFTKLSQEIANGHKVSTTALTKAMKANFEYANSISASQDKVHNSSKVTTADLAEMAKQGQISAKDIEATFEELGNGKYDKAAENMLGTLKGMDRTIKARSKALVGDVLQPITNMKNPIFTQISKWVSDPKTDKEFKKLGNTISRNLNKILTAFGGKKGKKINITGNLDKTLPKISKAITNFSNVIIKHKKDIKDFIKNARDLSKVSFKVLLNALKLLQPILEKVLSVASKHPKAFTNIALGMMAMSKASKGISAVTTVLGGLTGTIKGVSKAGKRIFISPKVDTKTGKQKLTIFGKAVKGVGRGIGKALSFTAKVATKGAKKSIELLSKGIKATGKGIKKGLSFTAKVATKGASKAISGLLKTAQVAGKGLKLAFSFLTTNPFGIALVGITLLIAGFTTLYKHNKKFKGFVDGIVKTVKGIPKKIMGALKGLPKQISKFMDSISKFFSKGWKNITKGISGFSKGFINSFKGLDKNIRNETSSLFKIVGSVFKGGWQLLTHHSDQGGKKVLGKFDDLKTKSNKSSSRMFNDVQATYRHGYDTINSATNTWHNLMSGHWNKLGKDLGNTTDNLVKTAKSAFSGMYDKLNEMTGGKLGVMVSTFHDKFNSIIGAVQSAVKGVHDKAVDLARGVIRPINSMLDGIRKGINWILDKLGASKISGSWEIPLPSYATGTLDNQGKHPGGFALVNDGQGEHYREMYQLPNGKVGMFPAERNLVTYLPEGTSVLDGEKTAELMKMFGLPSYAHGIGDFFGGLWDGAKELVDMAEDVLKKPIDFMKSVFKKFINISSPIKFVSDLVTAVPNFIAKSAINWVKKMFDDFGAGSDKNSKDGTMSKSDFAKVAKHAAKLMHESLSDGDIAHLYHQAMVESRANPAQGGGYDDHDGTGLPVGLFQYKLATWASYAVKGHANIHSALDQLMAVLNDPNWRSDLAPMGVTRGWSPSGVRRMENGGFTNKHQLIQISEGNLPEMVLPLSITKRDRFYTLLAQAMGIVSKDSNSFGNSFNGNNVDKLENKLDKVINSLNTLIQLSMAQIQTTKQTAFNKKDLYRTQYLDQSIVDYQKLGY